MLQPAAFLAKHLAGSVDGLLAPSYASQARSPAERLLAQTDTDAGACRQVRCGQIGVQLVSESQTMRLQVWLWPNRQLRLGHMQIGERALH